MAINIRFFMIDEDELAFLRFLRRFQFVLNIARSILTGVGFAQCINH